MTQRQRSCRSIRLLLHSAIECGDVWNWVLRVWGRRTVASAALIATYAGISRVACRLRTASSVISTGINVSFGLGFVEAFEFCVLNSISCQNMFSDSIIPRSHLSNNADGQILVVQLGFIGKSPSQGLDAMIDEFIKLAVLERVQVLLQVGSGTL